MIKTANYKAIYKETIYYAVPIEGEDIRDATERYYNGSDKTLLREEIQWTDNELIGIVEEGVEIKIPLRE